MSHGKAQKAGRCPAGRATVSPRGRWRLGHSSATTLGMGPGHCQLLSPLRRAGTEHVLCSASKRSQALPGVTGGGTQQAAGTAPNGA